MKKNRLKMRKLMPLLFLAPLGIGLLVFYIIPFGFNFINCFYSRADSAYEFTAIFHNFGSVINSDTFRLACLNNIKLFVIFIPLVMLIGLLFALLLDRIKLLHRFFRSVLFLPVVIPSIVISSLISIFFDENGFINGILHALSIENIPFLESGYSILLFTAVFVWKYSGYVMIMDIASLRSIPISIEEAALLDGANSFRMFISIKLPMMKNAFFLSFILSFMNSFRFFREIYLVYGKNPPKELFIIQHYINNGFDGLNYPLLAVTSVILTVFFFLIIGISYFLLLKKEKKEDTVK